MPRLISSDLQAALGQTFTEPIWLIQQDMGAQVIYSSTRELVDYLGNTYVATNGAKLESISNDRATWSLDNSDRSISILALGNDVGGNSVQIFIMYGDEATAKFTGVLDEWQTRGQRVLFSASSQAARGQRFPNARAELGTFNHLPAPGTNIKWGQQTIIIEKEQY